MKALHQQSISELTQGLQQKTFSCVELAQHFNQRISNHDQHLNSFITVTPEQALAAAKVADEKIANGQKTPLTGIPFAHKDLFCTQGIKTSCGSKMLDNFIAPYDATVTEKLKQSHAVCLGKVNMDEFAMGSSNETSYYGKVHNPWDLTRVPGGSSGGSAAAVAAGFAPFATATDTGGSIRQPASFCGLTGIKGTYGRTSRWGMVAFASSLDQAGIIARDAQDCAHGLAAIAGHDPKDSTSMNCAVPNYSEQLGRSIKGLKIGIPVEYFSSDLNPKIATAVQSALQQYEKLGAQLVSINLQKTALAVPTYYVIAPAEASANLSRFDGVRYGYRCKDPVDLKDMYSRSRAEGFGEEVKRRILIGSYVLSAGYFDAYFKKAQQTRRLIKQSFDSAFKQVDIIAGPTCPGTAFQFDSKTTNPVEMYLDDIYTIPVNLAGLPAMSVPCGTVDGLPVGLQLIGRHFDESTLLNTADAFQQATDWHTKIADFLTNTRDAS